MKSGNMDNVRRIEEKEKIYIKRKHFTVVNGGKNMKKY